MIFKNAMSFKAKMKQVAVEKGLTAQQVQQFYLMELFLEKMAQSDFSENFIIKGGYLIGSILGLQLRSTMDIDTTVKGFPLTEENVSRIMREIARVPTESNFTFTFLSVGEIREGDDYPGYRVKIQAEYERIKEVITLDVTTGDVITPAEVSFFFPKLLEEESIPMMAYPLETVFAEKLEAILTRGIATTRPRDFYDVYILRKLKFDDVDSGKLKEALQNTIRKRKSPVQIDTYGKILFDLEQSDYQHLLWSKYQKQYAFARDVAFLDTLDAIAAVMDSLFEE